MPVGACPECRNEVPFDVAPSLGQRAVCPVCQAILEVVSLHPVELDWAFEEPIAPSWDVHEIVA